MNVSIKRYSIIAGITIALDIVTPGLALIFLLGILVGDVVYGLIHKKKRETIKSSKPEEIKRLDKIIGILSIVISILSLVLFNNLKGEILINVMDRVAILYIMLIMAADELVIKEDSTIGFMAKFWMLIFFPGQVFWTRKTMDIPEMLKINGIILIIFGGFKLLQGEANGFKMKFNPIGILASVFLISAVASLANDILSIHPRIYTTFNVIEKDRDETTSTKSGRTSTTVSYQVGLKEPMGKLFWIQIDRDVYYKIEEGDTITTWTKKGLFGTDIISIIEEENINK